MKNIVTKALFIFAFAAFVLFFPKQAKASEGTVDLRDLTGRGYRCYAASVQMIDLSYRILITCRDLLYPAGDDIFNYILWGTSEEKGEVMKFGTLGFGRAEFKSSRAFTELYISTEKSTRTKEPEGPIVMRGRVRPIEFLQGPVTPGLDEVEPIETATPTPTPSTRERLIEGLRRAAVVSIIALVSLGALIFVLTRKR
ncbi:MAG: hypothetical protein PVJ52_01450 [Candidatus Woesebacteria bacterium]|jgi:hypothetical protein